MTVTSGVGLDVKLRQRLAEHALGVSVLGNGRGEKGDEFMSKLKMYQAGLRALESARTSQGTAVPECSREAAGEEAGGGDKVGSGSILVDAVAPEGLAYSIFRFSMF